MGEPWTSLARAWRLVSKGGIVEQHDRELALDVGIDLAPAIDAIADEERGHARQRERRIAPGHDDAFLVQRDIAAVHLELRGAAECLRLDERQRLEPRRRAVRSEERRVGKEWVSTCRSRWSTYH